VEKYGWQIHWRKHVTTTLQFMAACYAYTSPMHYIWQEAQLSSRQNSTTTDVSPIVCESLEYRRLAPLVRSSNTADRTNFIRASPPSAIHDWPSAIHITSGCKSVTGASIVSIRENTPVTTKPFWRSAPAVRESAQYVCNNCKTFPCMWELQLKEKRVWDAFNCGCLGRRQRKAANPRVLPYFFIAMVFEGSVEAKIRIKKA
jgi:hypothetical protein